MISFARQLRPLLVCMHADFLNATPDNPFYRGIGNLLSLAFPCEKCEGFGSLVRIDTDDELCPVCKGTGVAIELPSEWKGETK